MRSGGAGEERVWKEKGETSGQEWLGTSDSQNQSNGNEPREEEMDLRKIWMNKEEPVINCMRN